MYHLWGAGGIGVLPLKQCWACKETKEPAYKILCWEADKVGTVLFHLHLCSWHLETTLKNIYKRKHVASFFTLKKTCAEDTWRAQMQTKSRSFWSLEKASKFQGQYCLARKVRHSHHKWSKHNFWKCPLILFIFWIPLHLLHTNMKELVLSALQKYRM